MTTVTGKLLSFQITDIPERVDASNPGWIIADICTEQMKVVTVKMRNLKEHWQALNNADKTKSHTFLGEIVEP